MQILLRGLGPGPKLEGWEKRPFAQSTDAGPRAEDNRDLYERLVATEQPGDPEESGAHRRIAQALRRYDIFPPHLVSGVLRRTPVEVGDTVGILYHAPGVAELFFGARVIAIYDETIASENGGAVWRSGFTYRTLDGHPELGEETFGVDKNVDTGAIRIFLQSWSRPGTLLARAFAPIVRKLQVHASYAALDHLAAIATRSS